MIRQWRYGVSRGRRFAQWPQSWRHSRSGPNGDTAPRILHSKIIRFLPLVVLEIELSVSETLRRSSTLYACERRKYSLQLFSVDRRPSRLTRAPSRTLSSFLLFVCGQFGSIGPLGAVSPITEFDQSVISVRFLLLATAHRMPPPLAILCILRVPLSFVEFHIAQSVIPMPKLEFW